MMRLLLEIADAVLSVKQDDCDDYSIIDARHDILCLDEWNGMMLMFTQNLFKKWDNDNKSF